MATIFTTFSRRFSAPLGRIVARARAPAVVLAGLGTSAVLVSSTIACGGVDYKEVRKEIAAILDQPGYDDGSLGPVFVRLAWHASGTYDSKDKSGGSNGATMRFPLEAKDGANAGLNIARDFLEPVKRKFPDITYADLWTLAGVVAIEEMNGPHIKWRPGRADYVDDKRVPPNGRLPDAVQGASHIRDVFYRMGFNDQEIVALVGAHCLGRCHADRSGFVGPWTYSPTVFTNDFFKELLNQKWKLKQWSGPKQYINEGRGDLMMLPGDMALIEDPKFKKWVDVYAADEARFFRDFSSAFQKLEELGVPFPCSFGMREAALVGGAVVAVGAVAYKLTSGGAEKK